MHSPSQIKNFCVLAHVDHGKTTLCDYLISSNGIISQSLAGNLRFMDSRADEQEKQITVKTSVISLAYNDSVFNVVDSPGHFDFTSEVSIALRLCESAFILIDVVDGVTNQTEYLIRSAFIEGICMCIVFTKIDLLYTVIQLSTRETEDLFVGHLARCNAIMAELMAEEPKYDNDDMKKCSSVDYFRPEKGNVIFTSAKWGFGFSIQDIAQMYHNTLKWSLSTLEKTLWGPYSFDSAKQRIVQRKASNANTVSMFENFVLGKVHKIIEAFEPTSVDGDTRLAALCGLPHDMHQKFAQMHMLSPADVLKEWCPLESCLMRTIDRIFPSMQVAQSMNSLKLCKLELSAKCSMRPFDSENSHHSDDTKIQMALEKCDPSSALSIAFIAKITETFLNGHKTKIGVCKILSGTFHVDQCVTLSSYGKHGIVGKLWSIGLFQGNDVINVQSIGVGHICALRGDFLESVVKFGTLWNQPIRSAIRPIRILYPSVFRTVVRPADLRNRICLAQVLQELNTLDLQLDVTIEDNGDFVLGTSGVVHTERCLTDLKEIAQIDIEVSDPLIPLLETVHNISIPVMDSTHKVSENVFIYDIQVNGISKSCRTFLQNEGTIDLTTLFQCFEGGEHTQNVKFSENHRNFRHIYGKRENILLLSTHRHKANLAPGLFDLITSTFHIAMKSGPLAKLPVTGVCILLHDILRKSTETSIFAEDFLSDEDRNVLFKSLPIQFHQKMRSKVGVLVEPCYSCEVTIKGDEYLGKIIALINERRGKILSEEQTFHCMSTQNRFAILTTIPVSESQVIIDSIHNASNGHAYCQFFSSGWDDIIDYSVAKLDTTVDTEGVPNILPKYLGNTSRIVLEKMKSSKGLLPRIQLPKDAEKQKFANKAA